MNLDPSLITLLCLGVIGIGLAGLVALRLASRLVLLPCPSWLGWILVSPFNEDTRVRTTLQRLDLRPGMHVLDVGCGPGRLTVPLAREVGPQGEVTALDVQPAMLKRARARAAAANLHNIRFLQARAGNGGLERARFDRALLVTVLGEIPDRNAALEEIFAALKPDGMLSVTEIIFDPHFQSRGAVLRLAGRVGFREQESFGNPFAFTLNLAKPPHADDAVRVGRTWGIGRHAILI